MHSFEGFLQNAFLLHMPEQMVLLQMVMLRDSKGNVTNLLQLIMNETIGWFMPCSSPAFSSINSLCSSLDSVYKITTGHFFLDMSRF
jgi:hypothetical protein